MPRVLEFGPGGKSGGENPAAEDTKRVHSGRGNPAAKDAKGVHVVRGVCDPEDFEPPQWWKDCKSKGKGKAAHAWLGHARKRR